MSDTEDRWYVNVGSDDVRMMTLDELVDAFENGVITRDTLVVEVGGNQWQPLKEVADLGDEEPVPAAAPVPAPALSRPPITNRPPIEAQPAAQASFSQRPVSRESAWPPAAAWDSVAPAAPFKQTFSGAPVSKVTNSTIPVVQDLDLDLPAQSFKSGGKKKFAVFAVLTLAVAGGVGFAATRGSGPMTSPVPVPAAAPKLPDPTPTPYSKPAAEETTTTPAAAETKEPGDRLSDEQKKALLSADKDRDDKKRTRAPAPRSGGGASAPRGGGNSSVFKANGNANDPLNPTL